MLFAIIDVVRFAATILTVLVFIRVVISWVAPTSHHPLIKFVYRFTEPILGPIRNLLPAMGGIDFSPVLVLIAIQLVERLLIRILLGMANTG